MAPEKGYTYLLQSFTKNILFHYDAKAPHIIQILAPQNSEPLIVVIGKVS